MEVCVISSFAVPSKAPLLSGYGGSEWISALYSYGLAERGHDVTLIAAEGSKAGESEVFEVISPTWGKRAEVKAFKEYKEKLNSFDVIIDNSHYHYALRKERELKTIAVHHDWNPLDLNDIVADEFVCPSNAHAEHVSLMASRPVKTIYHGIPIEEYPFKEEKEDYLLFLGRMSPYKGADRAVEIAKEVEEELIIAGMDENVESRDYVFKVMKKANENGFSYLGKVSLEKKLKLLKNAKAVLLPYRKEYKAVYDLVYVESMACMTPVITTRLGSAEEEIIKDGETGFLVEDSFQSAVNQLDEINNERCRKRAKVFNLKEMIDNIEAVIG